ncbi:MAG: HD domain-containing protein [Candidatus Harrisonbacteria bacterium]|nr:HD domain-containing protein [Candidatus Harrisonbacteria bacterium]
MIAKLPVQKIVSDPILGLIDISKVLPMVDVREFQSLAYKYQLGLAFLLFPSATHTRKQHCLGAYQRTKELTGRWVESGMITKDQARNVNAYALYHDIGHGPFSHTVEPLFDLLPGAKKSKLRADDAMGIEIARNLKKEIEATGAEFESLMKFMKHEDPLYLAVHDKNLGMEKFDYLTRDAFYTIKEMPGVDYLSRYIYFVDGQVAVDERVIDQAKAIQEFYIKMSKHVYLRKKSAILQRLVQKMAYELLKEGMTVGEIWKLTDFGLLGRLEISPNPLIRNYYGRLMAGDLPKIAIEFKQEQFVQLDEKRGDKSLHTFGLPEKVLNKVLAQEEVSGIKFLADFEKGIAAAAGIPEDSVMVVPPMSHHRFVPEDVKVYGRDGSIVLLSDFYPNHFAAMTEYGKSHHLLRICAFPEHRDNLEAKAEKIKDYLLEFSK